MERSTDCEMLDREAELELGKPSVGPTEGDQRKRSSCSIDDSAESQGSHHEPLVGASSLQPATTDEGSSVALEEISRRIKRMKTLAGNSFGSSSDEMDSSAGGSLQTEGNQNAAVAASVGRPPRYPIVGPPPAQRANPDDTPYVYTTSPANGRRVYGFLYRYLAGDSKIMCVCHGEFFTPAQFVEHGGGGVVENPDQHIIVNPFPSAS